jgi:hypothetical protein
MHLEQNSAGLEILVRKCPLIDIFFLFVPVYLFIGGENDNVFFSLLDICRRKSQLILEVLDDAHYRHPIVVENGPTYL